MYGCCCGGDEGNGGAAASDLLASSDVGGGTAILAAGAPRAPEDALRMLGTASKAAPWLFLLGLVALAARKRRR
jgi:hypothetical protein